LATAAKAFEAIFVRQMLAAARQSGLDDSLIGGQGLETFRAMQDSHFADLAAQTGALGLAKQIEAQFARHLPPSETANGQ
jgi:flagellar protein FlgJ